MWAVDSLRGLISLGVGWELGEKVMKEKQATTNVVARFCDALDGPPIPWVPPCVSPSQFPGRVSTYPPTSLWRGEGQVRLSSVLRILGCRWLSPHPSIEGRGSRLSGWVCLGSNRGSKGGEVVVVEE
jgi:hypothetical protein